MGCYCEHSYRGVAGISGGSSKRPLSKCDIGGGWAGPRLRMGRINRGKARENVHNGRMRSRAGLVEPGPVRRGRNPGRCSKNFDWTLNEYFAIIMMSTFPGSMEVSHAFGLRAYRPVSVGSSRLRLRFFGR